MIKNRSLKQLSLFALCTLFITGVSAAGDPAMGKKKSVMCASCHGQAGKAVVPIYPNLAGQNAPYLVLALKAYKSKQRTGGQAPIMYGMAAALSEQDIENLAAYYSSLK